MKTANPNHAIRNTLALLALASAMVVAMFFGASPASATPVTSGLDLWLDASDATTLTIDASGVAEWRDKNGSAAKMTRQAGAPTVVASGIGGIPTVSFNTSSRMNDGVNRQAGPVTIFYVSRQTGGANNRVLSATNNNWLLGYWAGRRGSAFFDGNVFLNGDGASDTNPHLYAVTIGGSGQNSTVWAEGVQIASNQGGTTGPNDLQLNGLLSGGGNEPSNCEISEVLVYNRVLNSDELNAVGGYLAGKYGLTTSYVPQGSIITFGPGAVINQTTKTISWELPFGSTNFTLSPTYTLTSGSCVPASGASIDFSNSVATPVSYTVTDGAISNEYLVTVTVAGLPDKLNVRTYLGSPSQALLDPIANLMALTPNATGTTTAKIDFHGGTWVLPGSPSGNDFSVLWEGWFDVTKDGQGFYTFGTSSDDGSVVYLDLNNDGDFADAGERIVNNNNFQGDTSATGQVDLQMNAVRMVIGYYQGGGGYDMRAGFKKGAGHSFGDLRLINTSSGYFFAEEPGTPPAPSLTATPLFQGIRLDWTAAARATSYEIYRGTVTGVYDLTPIATTTSATTFNDMTAATGGPFLYIVKATNVFGTSPASNEVSASPSAVAVNQTVTFSSGSSVTKIATDAPFANTASAFPSGAAVTYSVTPASPVATVNSATGEVTLTGVPGTATIVAAVAATPGFNAAQATQTLTVNQAVPVITWTPTPIVVGTVLSGTQLNASSGGVPGTFVYTPPSGTLMDVVGLQDLSVQFSPDNTVTYSTPELTTVGILVVPVETTVIWNTGAGTWNTTAPNWNGQSSNEITIFTQGNNVIFNRSAGGAITIAAGMEPASTTVSATSGNYAFSGGPIAGSGSLTKSGDGSLTFNNDNTFTGGTVINAGQLTMNLVNGALGTGTVTLNGGTLRLERITTANPLIVNGGTLSSSNGFGCNWNGPVTLNSNLTVSGDGNSGTTTFNGIVSGVGGLSFTGPGALNPRLAVANTYTGPTSVTDCTLRCDNKDSLGSGALSVSNSGRLNLNYTGTKTVASLNLGGVAMTDAGTYGSVASSADFPNDTYFTPGSTGTVTVAPSGFSSWATTNSITGGVDGDSNNDGVRNGIAFFMNNTGIISNPSLDSTNTVTWPASATFTGTYEVQTSTDLVTWINVDPRPLPVAGILSYTLPLGAPGGKSFVRLLVTPTP